MSSEERGALPAGTIVYGCLIADCGWTFTPPPPDVAAPGPVVTGATLEESIERATLAILTGHYAGAEQAIEAHLGTHPLAEWAAEVARLRNGAAGTVAVKREDLALVHDYARHFDVDSDPAMVHVAEVLRTSERRPGSSPAGAD